MTTTPAGPDLDRWANDFLGFVPLLDIVPKDRRAGGRIKLRPNAIQSAFELTRSGRDIVLKPRQVGFTTWELARDVWHFLTRRGAHVVIVVQSSSDHAAMKSCSEKLRVMFEALAVVGIRLDFGSESISEWTLPARDAKLRIVEAGGSETSAEKKGRSATITRLHITELAFFEFAEATLNAILECVPDVEYGTEVTIESTANGAAGEFYERYNAAKKGESGYRAHFFRWLEQEEYSVPLEPGEVVEVQDERERELVDRYDATPEQVKWYRRKLGDKKGNRDLMDQEYPVDEETCWIVAGRLFFDRHKTATLLAQTTQPIAVEGPLRIWEQPVPGEDYVVVADPSEGTGGDPGAAMVYERATGKHVATLHGQFPPWQFGQTLAALGRRYNEALIVVERNNHGHAVLAVLLNKEEYPHVHKGKDKKPGWCSTEISRSAALDALEGAHRDGHWSTPDRMVVAEMLTFVVKPSGKAEAAAGSHDDLVMTAAIAQDVLSKPILEDYESFRAKR